jgi:hypothetical protein
MQQANQNRMIGVIAVKKLVGNGPARSEIFSRSAPQPLLPVISMEET